MGDKGKSSNDNSSWEEWRELSERAKKQADDFHRFRTEQEDALRVEREHQARLERERVASAYEVGHKQALRQYRDAFVHYFPYHLRTLDRHFPDAFFFARMNVSLSPLLPYDDPAPGVVEDDDEVVLEDEDVDLGGEGNARQSEEDEDPVTSEVEGNSDSGPAGGQP